MTTSQLSTVLQACKYKIRVDAFGAYARFTHGQAGLMLTEEYVNLWRKTRSSEFKKLMSIDVGFSYIPPRWVSGENNIRQRLVFKMYKGHESINEETGYQLKVYGNGGETCSAHAKSDPICLTLTGSQ
jgi:hypothetical protein